VSKVTTLEQAAALVPDGSVLGIGGVMDQMVPVAFLLALAARGARDLHCVTVAAGISIDLPVAAGCASEVSCAIVSFEDLGTAKAFRRAVESGAVRFHEHTELTIITRLTAALNGLPFLPTRAALGTDVARGDPDTMRVIDCPFTGAPLLACAALQPDVSVIHVHRADELGNAQLDHKHIWHDATIARAARTVIVTAEELVGTDEVRAAPEQTLLPGFAVDAVVIAPAGALPTSCPGRYPSDPERLRGWVACSGNDSELAELIASWSDEAADGH
jgi:glutaconate CoA-transferase, subunit A